MNVLANLSKDEQYKAYMSSRSSADFQSMKTIKNVKSSNYFSRYNGLNYYYNTLDDKYQLETRHWLKQLSDTSKVTVYNVKDKDTYDSIALRFYNNPTLYWIICDYNRIIDPLIPPKEGTVLYLPSINAGLEFE